MALKPFDYLLQQLRLRVGPVSAESASDGQMLQRFLTQREEAAFAILMQRHGPMVLGICRRLLQEPADVEDAFQATFLVLVHRADAVRKRESVGSFLHGVALRVAHRIRSRAQQRRIHERRALLPQTTSPDLLEWRDLRPVLDEELDHLPEKYRAPLVLCYLEGKTHEEAARQLGCTNGTVCGRLARARNLLRRRLIRRGVTLSAAAWPGLLTADALSAAVPGVLAATTLQTVRFHAGQASTGTIPARVMSLTEETAHALFLNKVNAALIVTLSMVLLAGAAVVIGPTLQPRVSPPPPDLPEPAVDRPQRAGPLDVPLPAGAVARLGQTRFRHGAPVAALTFSPDGKTLAAVSDDASVILWDPATGQAVRTLGLRRNSFGRYRGSLAFSRDGRDLAIGWDNSQVATPSGWWAGITRWDCVHQKQRNCLPLREPYSIRSIAFSPDEKHWAAADDGGGVFLWDSADGGQESKLDLPSHVSYAVAFSGDGKELILATCSDQRTFGRPGRGEVLIWNLAAGRVERTFLVDPQNLVEAMSLSGDGKALLVLAGNRASLWDLSSGEIIHVLKPDADVRCVAFAPDGKTIALGCWEPSDQNPGLGVISLLDPDTRAERRVLKDFARCLAFSPDGKVLATGRGDCTVQLWDTRTGNPVLPASGHTDAVCQLAVSPDGKSIVSAGEQGTVCVWDAATESLRMSRNLPAGVGAVRVTPEGQILATRDSTPFGPPGRPKPILWDVVTGRELLAMEPPALGGPICPVAVSPDGRTAAAGIEDSVQLWDVPSGTELRRVRGGTGPVHAVSFTADGSAVATREVPNRQGVAGPPCIRLWDLKTSQPRHQVAAEGSGSLLALSHDGKLCATCHGAEITVWDVAQGGKLRTFRELSGKTDLSVRAGRREPIPRSLTFAPDGKILLSGDTQGTICVWDIATGTQTRKLTGHRGAVTALAFLGPRRVVSGSSDTILLIWDLSGEPGASEVGRIANPSHRPPGADASGSPKCKGTPRGYDFRLVNWAPMPETNRSEWRTSCLRYPCLDDSNGTTVRIACPCLLPPAPVVRIKS